MHQVGYSDTTRRELIWENLTKKILDKYSQNPATVHLRKTADETLQDTVISVTAETLGIFSMTI